MIVRALLGAITKEEISTHGLLENKTRELNSSAQDTDRLKWQIAETRDAIISKLNIVSIGATGSPIETQMFSSAAAENLARESRVSFTLVGQDLSSVRDQRDVELAAFHQVSGELRKAESVLPVRERLLAQLLGEDQDLGNQLVTAKSPICPLCEVPIKEVLEEGCRISKVKCDLEKVKARIAAMKAEIASEQESISKVRSDIGLRALIPGEIGGDVKLDGNGLSLNVKFHDDERSTAAIDSLKVVAFDLAVLAMSIEGRTRTPGFLLHDSPREADLGLSIYHQLFEFARTLEGYGPEPLFQYILTTTPSSVRQRSPLRPPAHLTLTPPAHLAH